MHIINMQLSTYEYPLDSVIPGYLKSAFPAFI